MSAAIKHKDFITLLSKSKQKKRRNLLIELASSQELKAIIEFIVNILRGNVSLNDRKKKKLTRFKIIMREVALKSNPIKKKKRILQQKGGFLGALIPIALSAIGSLFPK